MSNPWVDPWSNSSTAPEIAIFDYNVEKATFAGSFIGAILYGLVTLLFFQCMVALLKSAHRREEGIKWWLIFYTVAMFSFVTVYTTVNLHIQSNSFIDNRKDYGPEDLSGPLSYQAEIRQMPLGYVPNAMFNLNNWLADGLLIYRCYIIYSTSLWAIALPCLLYFASLGIGIVTLYFQRNWDMVDSGNGLGLSEFSVPYISISVSLNVLLTLMIVIRLALHGRNIRTAPRSLAGISELYKAASTMFIESCALFSMNSLLVVGALVSGRNSIRGSYVVDIFFPILAEIQVIAPLLIIQRVANGSALTGPTATTRHTGLFNVRGQGEPTGNNGTPLCTCLKNSYSGAGYGNNPGEPGAVVERTTDLHPDGEA